MSRPAWPAPELYRAYEQALAADSALDFDDLILRAVRLLETRPQVLDAVRAALSLDLGG